MRRKIVTIIELIIIALVVGTFGYKWLTATPAPPPPTGVTAVEIRQVKSESGTYKVVTPIRADSLSAASK